MSFIMLSTIFLGMVTNFIMLNTFGLEHPALRYPTTVFLSYCWFLIFMRIYVRNLFETASNSSILDYVDVPVDLDSEVKFSGPEMGADLDVGSSFSALDLDEGGVVVLVLGALLAALVFGSGAYLIWYSPEILAECLLQIVLVSGMRKKLKSFSDTEWFTHIFKATIGPFLLVLVISAGLGVALRSVCPEANNFRDYRLNCLQ
jgi:hypothetical protein